MSKSNKAKDPKKTENSTTEAGTPVVPCKEPCKITSKTVATKPTDRARLRIGAGEEVDLTADKEVTSWKASPNDILVITPDTANKKKARIKALDKAGDVTITAKTECCEATISFTVVLPSRFVMKRLAGTPLIHHHGVPDCGWLGRPYIEPTGVNFYNTFIRERDSQAYGTGPYQALNGEWHGKYDPSDYANGTSDWFPLNRLEYSDAYGSTVSSDVKDTIYAGIGAGAGTAPPFTACYISMPITWEWSLKNTGLDVHTLPNETQKHEIFEDGRCTSSKAGNSETTLYSDPNSGLSYL